MPKGRGRRDRHAREPRRPTTSTPIEAPEGWTAQRYATSQPGDDYVCPRCEHPVRKNSQHVVAWPTDDDQIHRHWHTGCWDKAVKEGLDRYRWL